MSENTKRMLTLLLAAAMLFSMLPMGVYAQEMPEPEQPQPEYPAPELPDAVELPDGTVIFEEDFEADVQGSWTASNNFADGDASVYISNTYNGTNSLLLQSDDAWARSAEFAVTAGKDYTIVFDVRRIHSDEECNSWLLIYFLDDTGEVVTTAGDLFKNMQNAWSTQKSSCYAPEGATKAYLLIGSNEPSCDFAIDNISVIEHAVVEEPQPTEPSYSVFFEEDFETYSTDENGTPDMNLGPAGWKVSGGWGYGGATLGHGAYADSTSLFLKEKLTWVRSPEFAVPAEQAFVVQLVANKQNIDSFSTAKLKIVFLDDSGNMLNTFDMGLSSIPTGRWSDQYSIVSSSVGATKAYLEFELGMEADAYSIDNIRVSTYIPGQEPQPTDPPAEIPDTIDMVLGENRANIPSVGTCVYFAFTPEQTGYYSFYSLAAEDTYAALYDATMQPLISDDDGGDASNFQFSYNMTAGETYILKVRYFDVYSLTGSFPVYAVQSPLVGLTFAPITIYEGTCGHPSNGWSPELDAEIEYYYYDVSNIFSKATCTATLVDGTTVTGANGYVEIDGQSYWVGSTTWHDPQDSTCPWTPGNTYTLYCEVLGVVGTMEVTIEESPLESITFTSVEVVENTNGTMYPHWIDGNSYVEYFRYYESNLLNKSTYTATLKNGDTIVGSGTSINYNGVDYEFYYTSPQSYDNCWTLGNTYNITVSIMGQTVNVPVAVTTLPLQSLSFTEVVIPELSYGQYVTEGDQTYFRYDLQSLLLQSTFNILFKDGTTVSNTGTNSFDYDGYGYNFQLSSNQSATNPWLPGNTYYITVSVGGHTAQIPVTISASPLQSITFTNVTVIENSCGHVAFGPNDEPYYHYNPWNFMENSFFTATFTDGTTTGGSGNSSIYYNGQWYGINFETNQSYENPWTAGNTYYITASVMGKSVSVPVKVITSPLVSLTVSPVTMYEGKGGTYNDYWYGDQHGTYYAYHWWNKLTYTAIMSDGTVINGHSSYRFDYDGSSYYASPTDAQGPGNQWTVGNIYYGQLSLMGMTVDVPVTIVDSPIVSVTFDPISVEEHTNGYWNWSEYGEYYHYSDLYNNISYTVTFADGSKQQGTYWGGVYYDGEYYQPENIITNQSGENPWLTGNTYSAQVTFGGKAYPAYVTITSTSEDNGYTYFLQNGQAIINGCTMKTEILEIPETIDGYPVVGIVSLGDAVCYAKELRIPDSVTMLSTDFLSGGGSSIEKLVIGSGVSALDVGLIKYTPNLAAIEISADNQHYTSVDGVVYDKAVTELIIYPIARQTAHQIPDTVTKIDVLFETDYYYMDYSGRFEIIPGAGLTDYAFEDGIIYTADKSMIIKATSSAPSNYVMPDSVTAIVPYAFIDSNVTSITVSNSVTAITYGAFAGAVNLEKIVIPSSVWRIDSESFKACDNLKEVHISDLTTWCNIRFNDNPLFYAHDLYLNGEKIVDLVLPETVTDLAYAESINRYAFQGGSFETVTIPARIKQIGYDAFEGCENLNKVYITDLAAWSDIRFVDVYSNPLAYARNLYLNGEKIVDLVLPESVGQYAYGDGSYSFYNIDIKTLTVPSCVYTIGSSAFYGSSVESIIFENSKLRTIGDSAFEGTNVKTLNLPDSLFFIGTSAFADCADLQSVNFGVNLSDIGPQAFQNTGIKTLFLPNRLNFVGSSAFSGCKSLKMVDFGTGITVIPWSCFAGTGLTTVTIPQQITNIDGSAFANSKLTNVVFECDQVVIWEDAFRNCPMDKIEFGSNVIVEGGNVFAGTTATQVKLNAGVTSITYREFAFNKNLVSVSIPESVQWIDGTAFQGDTNLSHVLYSGTQAQWDMLGVWSKELLNATLHVNARGSEVMVSDTCTTVTYYCAICDKEETLRKGQPTHEYNENGICTVCGSDQNNLTAADNWVYTIDEATGTVIITAYTGTDINVIMPGEIDGKTVTAFTEDVFAYNYKITSVTLPGSITEVPAGAFRECTSLREVTAGSGVTSIGGQAFYECKNLTTVNLPDTVTSIAYGAFMGCRLNYFEIPESVTSIGEAAFLRCGFESIEIPNGVTEIAYSAFAYCWNLEQVVIPDSVTHIAYQAFAGTSIKEFTIPASITHLDPFVLKTAALETVIFLGDRPFMNMPFGDKKVTVFYAASKVWPDDGYDNSSSWYACDIPVITKQPISYVVQPGETVTLSAAAYGHRLRYQWYYAAPGSDEFAPIGGDSIECTMTVDATTSGGKLYCLATDPVGQTAMTNIVTLRNPAVATGIRLAQLPYTLEYDLRQEFRTRGLEVVLVYDDNSVEEVFDYTVSGFDPNVGGMQIITVTYGDYTATFPVTVNDDKLNFVHEQESIEISANKTAVESDVVLVVEKVAQEDNIPVLPSLPEILQEAISVVFDIRLEKDGQAVQPNETVRVSIPVPEHMESKRCKVFHIGDDGVVTDMNAHYEDGRMVFNTDHFSNYAVVEVSGARISGTVLGTDNFAGITVNLISNGEILESMSVSESGAYLFENVVANDYVVELMRNGKPINQFDITVADQDVVLDLPITSEHVCADENKDHICDNGCEEFQGTHADADFDHACDYGCAEAVGTHADADFNHACDYGCAEAIGTHADSAEDKDHVCDYGCGAVLEQCADTDDHLCDVCGDKLSECADDNKDGKCDVCGESTGPVMVPDVKIANIGLSLQDYIGVQVAVQKSKLNGGTYDKAYLTYTVTPINGDQATTGTSYMTLAMGSFVGGEVPVMAWSMSDEVTITVYYEVNGVTYQGETQTTSVRAKAMAMVNGTNAKNKAVCIAMLNYGAAVQDTFNHCDEQPEYLANYELSAEQKTLPAVEFGDTKAVLPEGSWKPATSALSFGAKVLIQFPIRNADFSNYEVRYAIEGVDGEFVVADEDIVSQGVFRGPSIAAKPLYMRSQYNIAIYNKTTGEKVYGDIVCSIAGMASSYSNPTHQYHNVAATMLVYGDAVAAL